MKQKLFLGCLLLALSMLSIVPALAQDEFVFGLILVGPENDNGWSQAHYEGGRYVEETIPGAKMLYFPSLNPFSNPEATVQSVAAEMIDQGAKLIFTTSDFFQNDTDPVAAANPDVVFINISGDHALTGDAPSNVGNLMGQMEIGKLIGGCAAGLATETGSIGYLGPIIIPETRRLAASSFLGAKYCYEHYRGGNPDDLTFTVTWIGDWVPTPATLNPTEETDSFFDNGADVVISGIDTPDALTTTGVRAAEGERVFAVPYDHRGVCELAAEVCLGVPFFNWGPDYARIVQSVMDGTWEQSWEWVAPNWSDMNNPATSAVGFEKGAALTEEQSAQLDEFISYLASYATNPLIPASFPLWVGPLNLQDGTPLAGELELVDPLDVWYLSQLLEGINGASS